MKLKIFILYFYLKFKTNMRSLLSIFMLVFVLGCSKDGETGPQGPPGEKGSQGEKGVNGQNGSTILSGKIAPSTTVGVNGDFYLNLSNGDLYGPKTSGGWGSAFNLKGPTGATGIPGATILSGQGVPSISIGRAGDFYINLKEMSIYGPKSESSWGNPTSLKSDTENGVSVYIIKPDWGKNYISAPNGNIWIYSSLTDEYTISGDASNTYFVTYAAASPGYEGLSNNISLNQWKELVGEYTKKYYKFSSVSIGLNGLFDVRVESNITSTGSNATKFKFSVAGSDGWQQSPFRSNTIWILVKAYKYEELKAKGIARENVERYLRLK
ncbi:collagen-like protein [Sphingobacterium sp. Ag1]|uniref:collagen-like protein n=1 Tax=Sphingobacterium sp. Ag1 TaxID=1643451 RepID=UPI00069C6663|nr:collagen-like protein [Sphingobacterium sp. Ag1]